MSTSLTDKEYYQLTISVAKALISQEVPIKPKHARATIIGTHHNNGAHAFWTIVIKQSIKDNRITAWKFCHVLHLILRDGHHLCLQHSIHHLERIAEIGKSSAGFHGGYGLCINQYTKLLVAKLNFHDRNSSFPGNLVLKQQGELDQIVACDIHYSYQLTIEMFDYLDEILTLQTMVFYTMNQLRLTGDSTAGQCRLGPLVFCAQDSYQLYSYCVHLMCILHKNVSHDLLKTHSERFETIFRQLKHFYMQISNISYLGQFITIPTLPLHPPNFVF